MVDKNNAKAKFVDLINETILVLEDQKVTSTLFLLLLADSQRRTSKLYAGKPWISSRHIIYKLW